MLHRKSSPQSIAANRANALLSTGPRSAQGKRQSALNSLKHGLLAAKPVFRCEEERLRFGKIRTSILVEIAPVGPVEMLFAEDVANLAWKLILTTDWEFQEWDRVTRSGRILGQLLDNTNFSVELRTELADHWSVLNLDVRASDDKTEAARKTNHGTQVFGEDAETRSSEGRVKGESKSKPGTRAVDLRFTRSLELAKRYRSQIRAELYRAIGELWSLQEVRQAEPGKWPSKKVARTPSNGRTNALNPRTGRSAS